MGEILWEIEYLPIALGDLDDLEKRDRTRVLKAIGSKIAYAPEIFGKPLRGTLKPSWSLRVGDYRVIYLITKKAVVIVGVMHRREVYKEVQKRFKAK